MNEKTFLWAMLGLTVATDIAIVIVYKRFLKTMN